MIGSYFRKNFKLYILVLKCWGNRFSNDFEIKVNLRPYLLNNLIILNNKLII